MGILYMDLRVSARRLLRFFTTIEVHFRVTLVQRWAFVDVVLIDCSMLEDDIVL
eukprot:c12848_g1_i1 orf=330-491(+)